MKHELVLEDSPAPTSEFVAYPTRGFSTPHTIIVGEPFRFSTKYGTRIYALPPGTTVPGDVDRDWFATIPASGTFLEIASVPLSDPLAHVVSTIEIGAVTSDAVAVSVVSERQMDANGNEIDRSVLVPLLFAIM